MAPRGYSYRVRVWDPFGIMRPAPPPRTGPLRMRFSPTEVRHLAAATLILTLAFGIHFSVGRKGVDPALLPYTIALAFPAVLSGFVVHELGHKYLAQRYGCWSEFRAWFMGLFIALLLSPYVLFAAPGAVMISGYLRRSDYGRISLMGPMTNLAIAIVSIPLYLSITAPHFGGLPGIDADPDLGGAALLAGAIYLMIWINIVLAGFNLIPLGILDGAKVMRWSPAVWLAAFAAVFIVGSTLAAI